MKIVRDFFSVNVFVIAIRENIDIININFPENLLFLDDHNLIKAVEMKMKM